MRLLYYSPNCAVWQSMTKSVFIVALIVCAFARHAASITCSATTDGVWSNDGIWNPSKPSTLGLKITLTEPFASLPGRDDVQTGGATTLSVDINANVST